jgi:FkbM family methyltransferase
VELEQTQVASPRGRQVTVRTRPDTTDLSTIGATFDLWGNLVDEYGLRDTEVNGLFVDVGAHIGSVSLAVLLDNPDAKAIAIEPLPENVDMIATNAGFMEVLDRLRIVPAAVGNGKPVKVRYGPGNHRYIGDIRGADGEFAQVPSVTMSDILAMAAEDGFDRIALLKTDCEGGEWSLFGGATPEQLGQIDMIIGEYHTLGGDHLTSILGKTHIVVCADKGDSTGSFSAVIR